jgi:hypothetical protein
LLLAYLTHEYDNANDNSMLSQQKLLGNLNRYFLITIFRHRGLDMSLGLQEVESPRISRQSANEGGQVVSPKHRPPLPPGDNPGTHICQWLSLP